MSFLSRQAREPWALQASTLPEAGRLPLLVDVAGGNFAPIDKDGNTMLGNAAVTRILPLRTPTDEVVIAVLQQPLATALEPFRRLQRQLAWTSLLAVVISILAGVLISRGIARPVRELADSARRIAAGDYSKAPPTSNTQEIADLATAFRTMQEGIATRETQIMDLAYRDTLTGLPNRTLYGDRLARQVLAAQDTGTSVSVLLMDLDHFKYVNDTLGHPIGDLLLVEVASRLEGIINRPGDTVARLGGDEFAILLPHTSVGDAEAAAAAVLGALEAPMTLEGHIVDVRANVGIAVFPEHGREAATLLRHADVAMYEAKRANAGVVVFDQRYDQGSRDRLSLMSDLRKAVDRDELTLVYQPKVSLRDVSGRYVEALVRWRHPTRGLIAPNEFIPFAEQTGYIRSITMWVLSRAIAQCAAWRTEGLPMHVSINISARDVMDAQLPDRVVALLENHGCAARWISFEITESAILDDPGHAVANLNRLHALGCQIAIDDYGTGYSSLAYLRRLPLHELKIDKSFVMGMSGDANDDVIVRSTIELAHNMHLMVVAEGVEDEATLERLRALGCDMAQGFHLGRPVTPEQVAVWARDSIASRGATRSVQLAARRVAARTGVSDSRHSAMSENARHEPRAIGCRFDRSCCRHANRFRSGPAHCSRGGHGSGTRRFGLVSRGFHASLQLRTLVSLVCEEPVEAADRPRATATGTRRPARTGWREVPWTTPPGTAQSGSTPTGRRRGSRAARGGQGRQIGGALPGVRGPEGEQA